jgi:spore germination cell wall hydrolase CwlJ-like protein
MLTNNIATAIIASALQSYPEAPVEPLEEVMCLTEAIYHEARGEPLEGLYGVALVIDNRKESSKYPDTYCGVVHQPEQFSYRNTGQPYTDVVSFATDDADKLWWSVQVALDVSNGHTVDWLKGSTHYVNRDKLKKVPKWLQRMEEVANIGGHTFLKET